MQYHIKRCTAPCVGYVSKDEYDGQIRDATNFLKGNSQDLQKHLAEKMKMASDDMNYEQAAKYRDRIRALTAIQSSQNINVQNLKNADVIALIADSGFICVSVFFIRNGQNFGNRTYFPRADETESSADILGRFLIEFYTRYPVVPDILVNLKPTDHALLEEALNSTRQKCNFKTITRRKNKRHRYGGQKHALGLGGIKRKNHPMPRAL